VCSSDLRIGQIGCSDRAFGHREMLKSSMINHPNIELASVCDIWSVNLEKAAADVKKVFGNTPQKFKYSEDLLADRDLDAVMIGTGDHQHARIMAEVVRAGKDVYCEKPMANTLEDAKLARQAVLESGRVAQMGSQWLSCPYHQKVREIVRSGRLGKITKIEQSWNYNGPRWHVPKDADIAAIREEDTDWERWLLGRPWRPFDPRVYFEFRIFKDFSGGITDQWYSHGAGLVHFFLDTFIPNDTVANGGIFAWHDVRENPDTFQCLATFQQKEVLYSYSSSYGNSHGDHTVILSTHILSEVEHICSRVLIINKGCLVAEDTPAGLAARMQGGERVRLQTVNAPPNAIVILQSLPEVARVNAVTPNIFEVECADALDCRPRLAQLAVEQGWGLLELRAIDASLEEVFIELTTDQGITA